MTKQQKQEIRRVVSMAMQYWPNAHLGDKSRGEDMRSAFRIIRRYAKRDGLEPAIQHLEAGVYRHMSM